MPVPDEVTSPYWSAAKEGVLRLPWCSRCRRWHHVPALSCPWCGGEALEQRDVSGRGVIYSWTTISDAPGPAFVDLVPLVVGVVELVEQVRLLITTNIVGARPDQLWLGAPVEVFFERLDDEIDLPQFRLVEE